MGWSPGRRDRGWDDDDWDDRDRGRRYDRRRLDGVRPSSLPASASRVPNAIRQVPDRPRGGWVVAVDDARHYVNDGYRCRLPRERRGWRR